MRLKEVHGQVQGGRRPEHRRRQQKLFESLLNIDILVNNLGIFEMRPFLEISDGLQTLQTNVLSGVRVTRRYLPHA